MDNNINTDNNTNEIDILELLQNIWIHKFQMLKWGVVGLIIGIVIAFSLPKEYTVSVIIAPEGARQGSSNSIGGLAGMVGINFGASSTAGITEKIYPDIIKSSPFLLEFANIMVDHDGNNISMYNYITKDQKYPWWNYITSAPSMFLGLFKSSPKNETIIADTINIFNPTGKQLAFTSILGSRINIIEGKGTSTIELNVKMQDPIIAATIADSVMTKLQLYMTNYRTSKARTDLSISQQMLDNARQTYYEADAAYSAAQDRNQNLITQLAKMKIDRLENEKKLAFSLYQQLAMQVEMDKGKLQEITPIVTIIEPPKVPLGPSSPNKQLIILALTFLGCFAYVFKIISIQLLKR